MESPVSDRLSGASSQMGFEQFHQSRTVDSEAVGKKIDVQIRIRQILPSSAGMERNTTGLGSPIFV